MAINAGITVPSHNNARYKCLEKTDGHMVITFEPHTAKLCSTCKIASLCMTKMPVL